MEGMSQPPIGSQQPEAVRDIDLVMVTGAGASREFGVNGEKLPLMGDWSDSLVAKLEREWSYLEATGLSRGLDGAAFEAQLGKFLRQVDAIAQSKDLLASSAKFTGVPQQLALQLQGQGVFAEWHNQMTHHFGQITDLIHQSLYEEFAEKQTNTFAADACYRNLFLKLGVGRDTSFVYATTNYDPLAEHAIRAYGRLPDAGSPLLEQGAADAELIVDNLLGGIGRFTPVLHLHGCVGWYRRPDGNVRSLSTTKHQSGFGTPIVMLPDPDKVYDKDDVINTLWREFALALRRAKRVLVLGHSLNDAFLLRSLVDNVWPYERIAVTGLPDQLDREGLAPSGREVEDKVRDAFGGGPSMVPLAFGSEADRPVPAIESWTERLQNSGLL
jgi:hypothetical protein